MTPIRKLLVANRAEIASRIMRTARAMNIATVAVHSDADRDLPFVAEADEAVRLPGASPADTYLRADLLIDAALAAGADAVHPGYGFLSEQAEFAQRCADHSLIFVGPPAEVIRSMGSKINAKELMAAAGVPVLPGVTVPGAGAGATVPGVTVPGAGAAAAAGAGAADVAFDVDHAIATVGLPALVKASAGGGGRGMRIVRSAEELVAAVAAAQREAAAAFGDGTVFLERLVERPRHVEVQVLGDVHGNVIHLFERECSIQRRHQKILEEAPAARRDPQLRDAVCAAAVAAAKAIGYVNAGTVEFVVGPDGFWFLEVNTRLQVEHAVTEMVTGVDLVELQLRIAAGEPIPDTAASATINGHAIEARLYAEDVAGGFLPTSGRLARLRVPELPGVRIDAGYGDGSVISTHYDAMLAKVVAWAPTRAEAAARLADTLARAEIHGVTTNRDLLVRVARHPEFIAGDIDTGFLERHDPAALGAPLIDETGDRIHAAVAGLLATEPVGSPLPTGIPAGWRNVGGGADPVVLESALGRWEVERRAGRRGPELRVNGEPAAAIVAAIGDGSVVLDIDGRRRSYRTHHAGDSWYIDSPLGSSVLKELPRFPDAAEVSVAGSLVAPLPGTVVQVAVRPGDQVEAGQTLVAIEAMKMEHAVRSPARGTVVQVLVEIGTQVDTGTPVVVVEEEPVDG